MGDISEDHEARFDEHCAYCGELMIDCCCFFLKSSEALQKAVKALDVYEENEFRKD